VGKNVVLAETSGARKISDERGRPIILSSARSVRVQSVPFAAVATRDDKRLPLGYNGNLSKLIDCYDIQFRGNTVLWPASMPKEETSPPGMLTMPH